MEEAEAPGAIKNAAIVQLFSGLVNFFFVAGAAGFFWSMFGGVVTGICTMGMCPIGSLCGFVACLIGPVAIVEIVAGIMGITNPKGSGMIMKVAAGVELLSVLIGSPVAVIAGGVTMMLLNNDEVTEYWADE